MISTYLYITSLFVAMETQTQQNEKNQMSIHARRKGEKYFTRTFLVLLLFIFFCCWKKYFIHINFFVFFQIHHQFYFFSPSSFLINIWKKAILEWNIEYSQVTRIPIHGKSLVRSTQTAVKKICFSLFFFFKKSLMIIIYKNIKK